MQEKLKMATYKKLMNLPHGDLRNVAHVAAFKGCANMRKDDRARGIISRRLVKHEFQSPSSAPRSPESREGRGRSPKPHAAAAHASRPDIPASRNALASRAAAPESGADPLAAADPWMESAAMAVDSKKSAVEPPIAGLATPSPEALCAVLFCLQLLNPGRDHRNSSPRRPRPETTLSTSCPPRSLQRRGGSQHCAPRW